MITLGIDPGSHRTGYALIKGIKRPALITCGLFEFHGADPSKKNLIALYDNMVTLITKHRPDVCAIEKLFFFKNQKTYAAVSECRGVLMLAALQQEVPVVELTPLEVKQAVTGSGRADKQGVAKMVAAMLNIAALPGPDDVSDAVAIALAGSFSAARARRLRQTAE